MPNNDNFVFDDITAGSNVNHRLTVGLRTLYYVLNVSVQAEFQMLAEDKGIEPVSTISAKLGLDF